MKVHSVTLKPILGCNLNCKGCYEGQIFKNNNYKIPSYDLGAIFNTLDNLEASCYVFHGGEALLMPIEDMRKVCEYGKKKKISFAMQTNGLLIKDEHLDLMKEFKISVGVSLNGPGELNRDRQTFDVSRTDKATEKIHENVFAMRKHGIEVGMITVMSTTNCGDRGKYERLANWAETMSLTHGIVSYRFNPMYDGKDVELTAEQLATAWVYLCERCFSHPKLIWNPFREFADNVCGLTLRPCWMNHCDPYSTAAVFSVLGDGGTGTCLRVSSNDGIPLLRTNNSERTRSDILEQIPFEQGGCGGCRYWRVCHGGCPAEGEKSDWRNKSRFCLAYMELYNYIERRFKGLVPSWKSVLDTPYSKEQTEKIVAGKTDFHAFGYSDPEKNVSASTYEGCSDDGSAI